MKDPNQDSQDVPSKTVEEEGRSRRFGIAKLFLPWTTTSLKSERELQAQIAAQVAKKTKYMIKNITHKGEMLTFEEGMTLWDELGIHNEREVEEVIVRLIKRRNVCLLITICCGILFLGSLVFRMPILALLLALVLMIEAGVEYAKALWRIECISKNEYIPFRAFLFGKN